jgi:ABC-type thiamine transport system substrate-binding protein
MFDKLSIEDILSVDLGYVSPSYDADESEEKESFLEELELQVITF